MSSRTGLIILSILLAAIASVAALATFGPRQDCCVHFRAGIADPYAQLLRHMRQLAEAGKTDELRRVITEAQERSDAISAFCAGDKGAYKTQVEEIAK